jgi:hypothetical protein
MLAETPTPVAQTFHDRTEKVVAWAGYVLVWSSYASICCGIIVLVVGAFTVEARVVTGALWMLLGGSSGLTLLGIAYICLERLSLVGNSVSAVSGARESRDTSSIRRASSS